MSLILLLACDSMLHFQPFEGNSVPDGLGTTGTTRLVVEPASLNLESPLGVQELLSFELSNTGEGTLHLDEIELGPGLELQALSTFGLAPDESVLLELSWTIDQLGESESFFFLRTQDQELRVPLQVQASGPLLHAELHPLGELDLGCSESTWLLLDNLGSEPLTVDDIELPAELQPVRELQLPVIEPGETWAVELEWSPVEHGFWTGELLVHSDDPLAPTRQILAEGLVQDAWQTESSDLLPERPIDLLIALDWSEEDDMVRLIEQRERMLEGLDGLDYQIAFVTEDDGCFNVDPDGQAPWLDADQDRETQDRRWDSMSCQERTNSTGYWYCRNFGSDTERAFTLIERALAQTEVGDCNQGFLRPRAQLALMALSDEPEQSAAPWRHYLESLQSLKEDPGLVSFHGVGGDYPEGCNGDEYFARWYPAVAATGGYFGSSCELDMSLHVDGLVDNLLERGRRLKLEGQPQLDSLRVELDGMPSEDWSYEPTAGVLVVHAPGPHDVAVHYLPEGTCR